MRTPNALLITAFTTGFAALVAAAIFYVGPKRICESSGGRWASTQEACVTRSCFKSGNCGKWAYAAARCSKLKHGDERAEVYFQLGDPDEVVPDGATWHAAKGSSQLIVAAFKAERLESLTCPATQ
jgi:hypothetical protein